MQRGYRHCSRIREYYSSTTVCSNIEHPTQAGLFSAVTTAFLLVTCDSLKADPQDQKIQILVQISSQLGVLTGNDAVNASSSPLPADINQPFKAAASDVHVNALWFSSLICSLMTASLGMLVKQWLREYLAGDFVSPQARLRIRHFRHASLGKWKVYGIAAVLPLMLQVSLGLFFLGLCVWTMSLHHTIGWTSVPLVFAWMVVLLLTTVAPVLSPRCPYKTTLLKEVFRWTRAQLFTLTGLRSKCSGPLTLPIGVLPFTGSRPSLASSGIMPSAALTSRPVEEEDVVLDERADIDVLLGADAVLSDDELLGTTIWESLRQMERDGSDVVKFVYQIIKHRLQTSLEDMPFPLDLRRLTKRGWLAISNILADAVTGEMDKEDFKEHHPSLYRATWMQTALKIIYSKSNHALPSCSTDVLVRCMLFDRDTVARAVMGSRRVSRDDLTSFIATFRDSVKRSEGLALVDCIKQVLCACSGELQNRYSQAVDLQSALSAVDLPMPLLRAFTNVLISLLAKEATREPQDGENNFWVASCGQADETFHAVLWASLHAQNGPREDFASELEVPLEMGPRTANNGLKTLFDGFISRATTIPHVLKVLGTMGEDLIQFAVDPVAQALRDASSAIGEFQSICCLMCVPTLSQSSNFSNVVSNS